MTQMFLRRHNFQSVAWLRDNYKRELLDLDPPYQRRSVWNQKYKDDFIDTVILGYPAPSIFLHEDVTDAGVTTFHVVDGKQRLTTLFEFIDEAFPVAEGRSSPSDYQGKYFNALSSEVKQQIYRYEFTIEYVPTTEEVVVNEIFDRINRNTAKLSAQELRHARYDGPFISAVESMTDYLKVELPGIPNISDQSRKQMKDAETTAQLFLLLESGPANQSPTDLDKAFADREDEWATLVPITDRFKSAVVAIKSLERSESGLLQTRLRNQVDFYSLFGAVDALVRAKLWDPSAAAPRLKDFLALVANPDTRAADPSANTYYLAARSAAGDTRNRRRRQQILEQVMNPNGVQISSWD